MIRSITTAARLATIAATLALAGCSLRQCEAPSPEETPPPEHVQAQPIPPREEWVVTSRETTDLPASLACDGRMDKRWASPLTDPQWIAIDLGHEATIAGCAIHWEAAYGVAYEIQVSNDGRDWRTVYATDHSDGATDEVFFPPVVARYIRIYGTQRVHDWWGFSIYEIELRGYDERMQAAGDTLGAPDMETLIDSNPETEWVSPRPTPCHLDLDLGKPIALGGVWIDWGDNPGTRVDLLVSRDGETWEPAGSEQSERPDFMVITHPRKDVRYLRIAVRAAARNEPVRIREVSLRSPDVELDPLMQYRMIARRSRRGLYPLQFLMEQVYWTVVGVPNDRDESLLDEYGNFEPRVKAPALTPYLYVDQNLISAADADPIRHGLADGRLPLPWLEWSSSPMSLRVEAIARGTPETSASYVRYTLRNRTETQQTGRLFMVIRPVQVNPAWQFGGIAPIDSLEFKDTDGLTTAWVNDEPLYVSITPPAATAARAFQWGDIVEDLSHNRLPAPSGIRDAGPAVSGALAYDFDLEPGEETCVVVAAPLHPALDNIRAFAATSGEHGARACQVFENARNALVDAWSRLVGRMTLKLPDLRAENAFKTQLSYILINRDGPALQAGSRNYKRSFLRDGSVSASALLRMGYTNEVRDYINWYAARVQPDGWVPPILNSDGSINHGFGWDNEYDSQGQFIFVVMEYYRFTRDRSFLAQHFDALVRAMQYLQKLRDTTLAPGYMANEEAPERFAGILPKSISHEGYNPPVHSYWDVFWALRGWKDGRDAARVLGRTDVAEWANEQYGLLRNSFRESMNRTIEWKNIDFVPGCADYGDPDPISTGIALVPCEEADAADPQILRNTFERHWRDLKRRDEGTWNGYTPYEMRIIPSFIALGQRDRAKAMLDANLASFSPPEWSLWPEVVFRDIRKGIYMGDMPHTWIGATYINAVLYMLAWEQGDKLALLAGAPPEWMADGGIELQNANTPFGTLNLKAQTIDNTLRVEIGGTAAPPGGFELFWPRDERPGQVTVDGQPWTDFDKRSAHLPTGPHRIEAKW